MNRNAPLARNPRVVWRDEPRARDAILEALGRGEDVSERGWVILVDGGEMHELNLVAGRIWCLADGSRSAEDIAGALAEEFDAPSQEILADVEAFVASCLERGWMSLKAA